MPKLFVFMLAVTLAGSANAGWRDLRVDGGCEKAFEQSMNAFKRELSPAREYVFVSALNDIWVQARKAAEAAQGEYTVDEYYRQLDGLGYEEIVKYTDPTGDTAKARYQRAAAANRVRPRTAGTPPPANPPLYPDRYPQNAPPAPPPMR